MRNDEVSMYNLAYIYIYEDSSMKDIEKSIDLLIKSSKHFCPSKDLLCIALIKKYGYNFEIIKKELQNKTEPLNKLPHEIYKILIVQRLNIEKNFRRKYQILKNIDYVYDYLKDAICSTKLKQVIQNNHNLLINNITKDFYDGLGDLL